MTREATQEVFLKDVKNHKMVIELDNGVHRCLHFSTSGDFLYYFRITTWPGFLCISGDMGTFVFSRVEDMFRFFRGDSINLGYWQEKVEASGNDRDAVMAFDSDTLIESVRSYIEDCEDDVKQQIEEDVIEYIDCSSNEHEGIAAIYDYTGPGLPDFLCDMSPHCYKQYTYRYVWICRAIVWAIQQYDEQTTAPK